MKRLLYTCLMLFMIHMPALADETVQVEQLLQTKLDAVLNILQKKDIGVESKKSQIVDIMTPVFDFTLMAKLALGKYHWTAMNGEEQEEFVTLFTNLLKSSYLEKLTLYTNETITYETPARDGNKIHIPTVLVGRENKIAILYKYYKSREGWKLYDLEIQGISIITTYRSQFNQTLSKGTVKDLLAKLRKPEQN